MDTIDWDNMTPKQASDLIEGRRAAAQTLGAVDPSWRPAWVKEALGPMLGRLGETLKGYHNSLSNTLGGPRAADAVMGGLAAGGVSGLAGLANEAFSGRRRKSPVTSGLYAGLLGGLGGAAAGYLGGPMVRDSVNKVTAPPIVTPPPPPVSAQETPLGQSLIKARESVRQVANPTPEEQRQGVGALSLATDPAVALPAASSGVAAGYGTHRFLSKQDTMPASALRERLATHAQTAAAEFKKNNQSFAGVDLGTGHRPLLSGLPLDEPTSKLLMEDARIPQSIRSTLGTKTNQNMFQDIITRRGSWRAGTPTPPRRMFTLGAAGGTAAAVGKILADARAPQHFQDKAIGAPEASQSLTEAAGALGMRPEHQKVLSHLSDLFAARKPLDPRGGSISKSVATQRGADNAQAGRELDDLIRQYLGKTGPTQ